MSSTPPPSYPARASPGGEDYDRLWGAHLRRAMRPILSAVTPVSPGLAVDLGAGTGNVFRELRRLGRGTPIVEIDLLAPQGHRAGRQLVRATHMQLPLRNNCAGLVTACFSISSTASCLACLAEATRVLRSSGMLVIMAWEWDQVSVPRRIWRSVCTARGIDLPSPPEPRVRLLQPEVVAARMRRDDFRQVDIYRRELTIAESPESFTERMTTLRPFQQSIAHLDKRQVTALKRAAARELGGVAVSELAETGGLCALVARR